MLAVKSRNVKIKVLNDSKEVALIVYITTFAAVETAIMGTALQNYNNVGESLFTGHMLLATTAIVVITFVPKVCYACACVIVTTSKHPYEICIYMQCIVSLLYN